MLKFLRGLRVVPFPPDWTGPIGYCSNAQSLYYPYLFFNRVLIFLARLLYFIHSRPFHPLPLTTSSLLPSQHTLRIRLM
jgi:hypothetical protein